MSTESPEWNTPVWDAMNGDTEWPRLQRSWKTARIQADIALAQHGPWDELTRTQRAHTGKGTDVLIPRQRLDRRHRRVTMEEADALMSLQ